MGLSVVFVSGPQASGKSVLIRAMAERLFRVKPHYLRLINPDHPAQRSASSTELLSLDALLSAKNLEYSEEHIFEVLPDALTAIHRRDRYGSVLIEADADPTLRHAYPYDHRVFVMPNPQSPEAVFRDSAHAAEEFRRALDDTTAFASEMFGLLAQNGADDPEPHETRPDLTHKQMRGFLYSPLGDELATRIQLLPAYHGLVESDVIVVNTQSGQNTPGTDKCLIRIERLMARVKGLSGKRTQVFLCDPADPNSRTAKKLLKALKPMCLGGK